MNGPPDRPTELRNIATQIQMLADKIDTEDQVIRREADDDGEAAVMTREPAGQQRDDRIAQHGLEGALLQAQKMETLGRLAAGIAHDFNNTLAIVQGNLDVLQRHGDKVDNQEVIGEILSAVGRGRQLTMQLLAFGRKATPLPQVFDLAERLQNSSLKLLRSALPENIAIDLSVARTLPSVRIDPFGLENVLLNLVFNARDAMPNGGKLKIVLDMLEPPSSAGISLSEQSGFVLLIFEDCGTGMSAEVVSRLFEPFYTTKGVGKGTGLGMAMVRDFLEQAGGGIRVASAEGRGTRFTIYIPVATEASEGLESGVSDIEAEGGDETILLVEDDPLVRSSLTRLLKSLGYTVTSVENGRMALDILEQESCNFDLLITDVILTGDLSGPALAKRATGLNPALQVIALSGYPPREGEPLDEGVTQLSKPVSLHALSRAVRKALAQR